MKIILTFLFLTTLMAIPTCQKNYERINSIQNDRLAYFLYEEDYQCIYLKNSQADIKWLNITNRLFNDIEIIHNHRIDKLIISLGTALELNPELVFQSIPKQIRKDILKKVCTSVPFERAGLNNIEIFNARKEKLKQ